MEECTEYVKKGDAVQASEKAYKAAEEVVKALGRNAERLNTADSSRRAGGTHIYSAWPAKPSPKT